MLTLFSATGQKVAAVSFASRYTFIDSTGATKTSGINKIEYRFADAHKEVNMFKLFAKKKKEFDTYQKASFNHHTMIYDYDSAASYSVSNYKKDVERLYKNLLNDSIKWQINDTNVTILGHKTKLATSSDSAGRLYRVYYTDNLNEFKIRYGQLGIPGFVLRYEVERSILKGRGIDIATATDIDFYDGPLLFPNNYSIVEVKRRYNNYIQNVSQ